MHLHSRMKAFTALNYSDDLDGYQDRLVGSSGIAIDPELNFFGFVRVLRIV